MASRGNARDVPRQSRLSVGVMIAPHMHPLVQRDAYVDGLSRIPRTAFLLLFVLWVAAMAGCP